MGILKTFDEKKGQDLVKHTETLKNAIYEEKKVNSQYYERMKENKEFIMKEILPKFVSQVEKKTVTYEDRAESSSFNVWDGPGRKGQYWEDVARNPANWEYIAMRTKSPKELDAIVESGYSSYSGAIAIAKNKNVSKETLLKMVVLTVSDEYYRHWDVLNGIFNNPDLPVEIGQKLAVIIREYMKTRGKEYDTYNFTLSKMNNKYLYKANLVNDSLDTFKGN